MKYGGGLRDHGALHGRIVLRVRYVAAVVHLVLFRYPEESIGLPHVAVGLADVVNSSTIGTDRQGRGTRHAREVVQKGEVVEAEDLERPVALTGDEQLPVRTAGDLGGHDIGLHDFMLRIQRIPLEDVPAGEHADDVLCDRVPG